MNLPHAAFLALFLAQPGTPAGSPVTTPAAIVDSQPIHTADLASTLAELAGARALEEVILDRALAAELATRSLTLSRELVDAERTLLERAIADEARVDGAQAQRLLEDMRRTRGLGPKRYAALLWRNAALRTLAASEVHVDDKDVALALDLAFGSKVRARLIVVDDERHAAEIRARLAAQSETLSVVFAAEAFRASTDATGSRGGLLPEFHLSDPEFPPALRDAARTLEPGGLSPVLTLTGGYAILLLEAHVAPTGTPGEAERNAARERLRRRLERQEMDRVARSLLAKAQVTVFDDALRWSWETRPSR